MPIFNPDQWQALSPHLDEALDMTEAERLVWLSSLRRKDPRLAGQLETLLHEHVELSEGFFLEKSQMRRPGLAGQSVGAYKLISQIGQGGMGTVWLAERNDGRFERRVAVKLLNIALMGHEVEERFKREGTILGRLFHPHIAELIDAGLSPTGQPYLVLEYVEGEHIDSYCDANRLSVDARIAIFLDVLEAVAKAHARLIVHRDLKPSNVLVRNDGKAKLLDFGIAKLMEGDGESGEATRLTVEGGRAMTPRYAAPEQLTGEAVTAVTDVYALGVLLYVLLTGQHPAGDGPYTPADLVKAVVENEAPRPSDVVIASRTTAQAADINAFNRATTSEKLRRLLRGDLDTIIAKALKKDPCDRYVSVTTFADDLRRYLKHEPIAASRDKLTYRGTKFVRRNRATVALVTLTVAAICAGVVGALIQNRTARAERDFAYAQLSRAAAINDLNEFILSDAAPSGKPFTVSDLLSRAEHVIERQQDKHDIQHIEALISLGRQYNVLDEQEKSRRLLTEAYDLSRSITDKPIRSEASCTLASALAMTGDHARAEQLFHEGLREVGNEPRYALDHMFCLVRGTELARERGESREAIARMLEAQRVLKESPFESELMESKILMDMAESYRYAGRYAESNTAFEQASAKLTALGRDDTQTAVTLFNNWGTVLLLSGRTLESEKIYRRALDISRAGQTEDTVSPMVLVNYARALRELHRVDEAADYAERGYAKAQQAGAHVIVGQSLLLRAQIYADRKDLVRATAMLDEVEPQLQKNLPAGHIAFGSLASCRAVIAQASGDLAAALQFSNEAVSISEAAHKAGKLGGDYVPVFLTRRSDIKLQSGRADLAEADAARAVSLLQATIEPGAFSGALGRAYLVHGRALQAENKPEEARAAFRAAAEHLQKSVGIEHPDTRAALLMSQSEG